MGLENGQLLLYLAKLQSAEWKPLFTFPNLYPKKKKLFYFVYLVCDNELTLTAGKSLSHRYSEEIAMETTPAGP